MKTKRFQVNPLEGNLVKNMILFALPLMGTAFLQVLFGTVDTMVIGKFGSEFAMASVGASSSVINLIIGAAAGLSVGISIEAGMKCGQKDMNGLSDLLHSLPLSALCIGTFVTTVAIVFAQPILQIVKCPDSLMQSALIYFRVYFLSVPFMMLFTFLSCVMQSRGETFLPFVIQVSCGALNLVLNLFFVIVFHWDVFGVAIATVISQICSALGILYIDVFVEKEVPLQLSKLTFFKGFKKIFATGIPASIENVVMNLSGVILQSAINGFSETVISGNTVSQSMEGLMCIAFVGFSSASMVFVSQNAAAGQVERAKKVERTSLSIVLVLGELLGIVIYLASPVLIRFYTDSPAVAEIAKLRMFYMCLFYGLCGTMNVMSGCVRGLGNTQIPLGISIFCSCIFRITWILCYAVPKGTISAIYVSYPMCWFLATIMYVISFAVLIKKQSLKKNS